eukprot:842629-Amphidinium_carterae.2
MVQGAGQRNQKAQSKLVEFLIGCGSWHAREDDIYQVVALEVGTTVAVVQKLQSARAEVDISMFAGPPMPLSGLCPRAQARAFKRPPPMKSIEDCRQHEPFISPRQANGLQLAASSGSSSGKEWLVFWERVCSLDPREVKVLAQAESGQVESITED